MRKHRDKIRYNFDRFLAKGTFILVLSLFSIIFITVALIGTIIFLVEPDSDIGLLLWDVFDQTLDPGNLSSRECHHQYLHNYMGR